MYLDPDRFQPALSAGHPPSGAAKHRGLAAGTGAGHGRDQAQRHQHPDQPDEAGGHCAAAVRQNLHHGPRRALRALLRRAGREDFTALPAGGRGLHPRGMLQCRGGHGRVAACEGN